LENIAVRQLAVLGRSAPKRLKIAASDRLLCVAAAFLARLENKFGANY
jgi:hypothetical protein